MWYSDWTSVQYCVQYLWWHMMKLWCCMVIVFSLFLTYFLLLCFVLFWIFQKTIPIITYFPLSFSYFSELLVCFYIISLETEYLRPIGWNKQDIWRHSLMAWVDNTWLMTFECYAPQFSHISCLFVLTINGKINMFQHPMDRTNNSINHESGC